MLRNKDAAPLYYKSKDIQWVSPGAGEAKFDGSFIPLQGPNGGVVVIDRIFLTARFNLTVATATTQGEDLKRIFRYVNLTQVDGEKRVDQLPGDALRICEYAFAGAECVKEHQDFAAGTADVVIQAIVPLAKEYQYAADDTSLPGYMFQQLAIGMAQGTDMSLGTSVVTVNSGSYSITAMCHEEFAPVLHAVDCISLLEFDTTTAGTLPVNGRPHDLFLYVRGQNGGASLANLTDVFIPTMNLYSEPFLKEELQQQYEVARGCAPNLFSTKGNPVRTDPFVASATGTLRAVAALLSAGHKVWERPEVKNLQVKTTLAGSLTPIVMIGRTMKRKSDALRDLLKSTHRVNASYIKTEGKSRRNHTDWTPEQAAYLPEKFFAVERRAGKLARVPTKLFSGHR